VRSEGYIPVFSTACVTGAQLKPASLLQTTLLNQETRKEYDMPSQIKQPFTSDKIEGLFPSKLPQVENRGVEALQSQLIEAFENALREGMTPLNALSVILGWVAAELSRVHPGQMDKPR
jgi:hypothetical protein